VIFSAAPFHSLEFSFSSIYHCVSTSSSFSVSPRKTASPTPPSAYHRASVIPIPSSSPDKVRVAERTQQRGPSASQAHRQRGKRQHSHRGCWTCCGLLGGKCTSIPIGCADIIHEVRLCPSPGAMDRFIRATLLCLSWGFCFEFEHLASVRPEGEKKKPPQHRGYYLLSLGSLSFPDSFFRRASELLQIGQLPF
jgi:hypothetical protein